MTICERMFMIMQQKKKKAADLCKILNIQTSVTTTWKQRNTDPPAKYLTKICEFLEITIEELLGIEETKLSDNEKELLQNFHLLPEREQIKWIARLEDAAAPYKAELQTKAN